MIDDDVFLDDDVMWFDFDCFEIFLLPVFLSESESVVLPIFPGLHALPGLCAGGRKTHTPVSILAQASVFELVRWDVDVVGICVSLRNPPSCLDKVPSSILGTIEYRLGYWIS